MKFKPLAEGAIFNTSNTSINQSHWNTSKSSFEPQSRSSKLSGIMSALYKTFSAFRLARVAPRAAFSTSIRTQKSAIDAAKDTLKEIDRKVADSAVKGIEKGGRCTFISVL